MTTARSRVLLALSMPALAVVGLLAASPASAATATATPTATASPTATATAKPTATATAKPTATATAKPTATATAKPTATATAKPTATATAKPTATATAKPTATSSPSVSATTTSAPPVSVRVACTSGVTYASSTNTIRVTGSGSPTTLAGIVAACPSAPLTQVDTTKHVWELRGDLVIADGASLTVSGTSSSAPVSELRLQSLSDQASTHVAMLEASNGSITLDHTHVRSWDDAKGAVDTDISTDSCPSGSKTSACPRGRAFIRALADPSTSTGTASLVIEDSEVDHLGYYASTSYGVSFKTEDGCSHTAPSTCGHVTGAETDSDFHDDYMGTYTWGAKGIDFLRNTYTNNFQYGLDPHDVSTYLDIEDNHFSYNGDHGMICSQACDHLTITGNESDHNGLTPWKGPTGDDADGQVHGIMLHRGITNTVVSGNNVHDNPNGAGIAIFDTKGDTISGNTLTANRYGIRLSVGASDTFTDNTVAGSTLYGVYTYTGSDTPSYTSTGGRPTGNTFTDTSITGTKSNPIKLGDTSGTTFTGTTISGSSSPVVLVDATGTSFSGSTFSSGLAFSSTADASGGSTTRITDPAVPLSLSDDAGSSTDLVSTTGGLFTAPGVTLSSTATSSAATLHLTSSAAGTTGAVTVTPAAARVVPSSGSATSSVSGSGTSSDVKVKESSPATTSVTIGGLTAGKKYTVTRSSTTIATTTASSAGTVTVTDAPPSSTTVDYRVKSA